MTRQNVQVYPTPTLAEIRDGIKRAIESAEAINLSWIRFDSHIEALRAELAVVEDLIARGHVYRPTA